MNAENALQTQSQSHPDGWGVGFYLAGTPHIVKSELMAGEDKIFKKVSGIVSSDTVLAHIRKSTVGENNILNTHPFQFGPWVFAHNGNIKDFVKYKKEIYSKINPTLRRFILGDTDSEHIFYFLLSPIYANGQIDNPFLKIEKAMDMIQERVEDLTKIIGPYEKIDSTDNSLTYLTFLLTNGRIMLGHEGGKTLHYSTYKTKCADRDICPHFSQECEAKSENGKINHLIFSSEPTNSENIWQEMKNGQMIGVDHNMNLKSNQPI